MKKKVLLTLFSFLALVTICSAQISFGPKLGVGLSNMRNVKMPDNPAYKGNYDYSYIVVPQIGVILNVQLGKYLAIRPELLYTQRGTVEESSTIYYGNIYTAKASVRASYIDLPINLTGCLPAGPGQIEVFAGPSFGYVIGGKDKYEFTSPSGNETHDGKVKGGKEPAEKSQPNNTNYDVYLNPFNVSLNFGAGYKFNNGLLIQLGYNLGLSNITAHSGNSDRENERKDNVNKFNTFTFGVAYLLGGKK